MKLAPPLGAAFAVALLSGCATNYPNTYEKNLAVNVHLSDPGLFGSLEATAGINDIRADCSSEYRGAVSLKEGRNLIGLRPGQRLFLAVQIDQKRSRHESSFTRGTVFTPAPGRTYEADVRYADGLYDFRLFEVGRSGRKELPLIPASACQRTEHR